MPTSKTPEPKALKRTLGLASLVLYGMGTIIGAGIYILVGEVAGEAGMAAPLSFLLAGVLAALTGISYAELAARYPEAAGAAAYVRQAFGSNALGVAIGGLVCAIGVIVAASLARGGIGYLTPMIDVPVTVAGGAVVVLFTAIACYGVKESVIVAAGLTVVEIGGLFIVIALGASSLTTLPDRWAEMMPAAPGAWVGIGAGAFLAFFAFSGFETLVTLSEEARDEGRTVPRAVMLAILFTTLLYMAVIVVAVLAVAPTVLAESKAPLCEIVDCAPGGLGRIFPVVALIATLNGVLIEIVMASRVVYGMAQRGWLPPVLGWVHAGRQTPVAATLAVGGTILLLTVAVPFEGLVRATSALLLIVFFAVNVGLARLHRTTPRADLSFHAPAWTPLAGAASCLALLVAEWGAS